MIISSSDVFRTELSGGPFAWPGGYPKFFVTHDGAALSFDAATENVDLIVDSIENGHSDGWRVVAVEINWEDDNLICDHTRCRIQSAYGEEN